MTARAEIEDFLFLEHRLLDEQRWDEWNALFADDGVYWMPAAPDQEDGRLHVSLIRDDALLRAIRIARFGDSSAVSLQPPPRGLRQVSNVMLDGEQGGELIVSARLVAAEFSAGEVTVFHAALRYRLLKSGESFRIREKRVTLVNCDGPLGDINLYL